VQLSEGKSRAQEIIQRLLPFCSRIAVAGSIRREKPEVRDIEICAVPRVSLEALREIAATVNHTWGTPQKGAFPSKYTCVRGMVDIDFFWPSKETWGLVYFIRTGSDDFVRRALTHWKKITNGGFSQGAKLFKPDGKGGFIHVPTPEEIDVFTALEVKQVAPQKRVPKEGEHRDFKRSRTNPPKDEEFNFD
jgi:DNA polymerase/3'-5' exonuclease PolX